MPACITPEFRELVILPNSSSVSKINTSLFFLDNSYAIAKPTTPAPITTVSTLKSVI